MRHSRVWHVALERVQYGRYPWWPVLHRGSGRQRLELASACHIRVADEHVLPRRRAARHFCRRRRLGSHPLPDRRRRMTDMMLTGRVYNAADGESASALRSTSCPPATAFDKDPGTGANLHHPGNAP